MIEQTPVLSFTALFMIGLMGAGHCVGMCGGIATALGFAADPAKGPRLVLGYNLGRIFSYALAGALVAALGYWGKSFLSAGPWLRMLAGVLLLLMGLYLADWWRVLVRLEKLGSALWRRIQPLSTRLLPVTRFHRALLLGMVWGWLPCGLVYTALAYAAATASPLEGALSMVAFGLGTAPAMIAGGLFSERAKAVLQGLWVRRLMALVMIVFGAWTFMTGAQHLQGHTAHDQQGTEALHEQQEIPAGMNTEMHHHH